MDGWAEDNFRRFSEAKCQVLHLSHNNPTQHTRFQEEWLGSCLAEKYLGMLVKSQLTMIQNEPLAKKANSILAWISNPVASRSRAEIAPPYSSLLRPHLKRCVQFWTPHCWSVSRERT